MLSMRQLTGKRLALLQVTAVIARGSMSAWSYSGGDDSHLDVRCEEAPSHGTAGGFVIIPHQLRFGQTVIQVSWSKILKISSSSANYHRSIFQESYHPHCVRSLQPSFHSCASISASKPNREHIAQRSSGGSRTFVEESRCGKGLGNGYSNRV